MRKKEREKFLERRGVVVSMQEIADKRCLTRRMLEILEPLAGRHADKAVATYWTVRGINLALRWVLGDVRWSHELSLRNAQEVVEAVECKAFRAVA